MRFDGWDSMEGRHLVFAYLTVVIVQAGYFGWVAWQWVKSDPAHKKATKPR